MRTATTAMIMTAVAAVVFGLATMQVQAADQIWTGGSITNGNWSTSANWGGNPAPGSTTGTNSTDAATFNAAINNGWGTSGTPVVIDSTTQNIGGLTFTGSPGNYYIGSTTGNSLLLSDGGTTQVTSGLGVTNPVLTINAPLEIQGASGGSYTFSNDMTRVNTNSYVGLQLLGGTTGVATAGNDTEITLTGSHWNGNNGYWSNQIANVSDGSAGGTVSIRKTGSGAWVLANNSHSGGVTLDEGTLVLGAHTTSPLGTGTLTINGGEISGSTASGSVSVASNPVVINNDFVAKGEYYVTLGPATLGTASGTTRTITGRTGAYLRIGGIANGTTADSLRLGNGTAPTVLAFGYSTSTYTGATTFMNNSALFTQANVANNVASSLFRFEGNSLLRLSTYNTTSYYGDLDFAAGEAWVGNNNGGNVNSWASFASTARAAGAIADIYPNNQNPTTQGLKIVGLGEGLIDQGYFYKGADYAYVNDPGATGGNYVRAPIYDTDPNFTSFVGGASIPDSATTNYNVTGSATAQGTASVNTLRINGASAIDVTQSGGTTLTLASGGLLRSGGGTTTISGGTLSAGNNEEYVFRTDAAADALTINSVITANGTNALTKSGLGTLVLGAANTHSGMTSLNRGTLQLSHQAALQNSTFRQFTGTNLYAGINYNTASTLIFDAAAGNAFTFGGLAGQTNISLRNSTNTAGIALTVGGNNADTTYSGNLSGTGGSLIKTGTGTLTLSGSNSYNGGTSVNNGTLLATTSAALAGYSSAGQVVFNGGIVGVQAGGSGWSAAEINTMLTNATKTSGDLAIDTTNGDFTYGNNITGGIGLAKLGANALDLTGSNSYSGVTTVREGTLRVGGSITGNTVVESGATLGGNGSIGGLVTVQNGGTLAPGASPDILTVDSFDLDSGSIFEIELFGTTAGPGGYDQLVVSGDSVNIDSGAILDLALNFDASRQDTFLLVENNGLDSDYGSAFTYNSQLLTEGASFNVGAYVFDITYAGGSGSDIVLTVLIPEPASLALLTLLTSGLLLRRRRRA